MSLVDVLVKFTELTTIRQNFEAPSDTNVTDAKALLKSLYDCVKKRERRKKSAALPELIVDDFDLEQIWQQIELQNDEFLPLLGNRFKEIKIQAMSSLHEQELPCKEVDSKAVEEEELSASQDESEASLSEGESKQAPTEKKGLPKKHSQIDDEFFNLGEMEAFLKKEEKLGKAKPHSDSDDGSDEENASVDLFDANSGEDEDIKYEDFFDEPSENQEKENDSLGNSEDDNESDSEYETSSEKRAKKDIFSSSDEGTDEETGGRHGAEMKSSLEQRQDRLREHIRCLETAAVEPKQWQLQGEVTAETRPYNSLLSEVVEFDVAARPAPLVTEAVTVALEDVIRQRIKDKTWDSVERKRKPTSSVFQYKKQLTLDQEKSKQSLAQIYEKEFMDRRDAAEGAEGQEVEEKEEPKEQAEIRAMMKCLFAKLDALSDLHYTPKAAAAELRIVANQPAIAMEEVAPVAASAAGLLAPEEVARRPKGEPLGRSERLPADLRRERRNKKAKQRAHRAHLAHLASAKRPDGQTRSKNVTQMQQSDSKQTKSSAAFFAQLQDEVTTQIREKQSRKPPDLSTARVSAKRLKL